MWGIIMNKKNFFLVLRILTGSLLYAVGFNVFVVPFGLFSGGAIGAAQLICIPVARALRLNAEQLISIVYILLNIPLFWIAWHDIGKPFLYKTILGVVSLALFLRLIPTTTAQIEDELVSVLLGGLLSGFGIGQILTTGGSAGGVDILGVWAVKRMRAKSVGSISLGVNAVIYLLLLLSFRFETFVYSVIYLFVFTLTLDRTHYQNINLRLMIFTKHCGVDQVIMERTGRGVTEWTGIGAFTKEETHILVTCINKYEYNAFVDLIHTIDAQAFIISDENVRICGNFEKRL